MKFDRVFHHVVIFGSMCIIMGWSIVSWKILNLLDLIFVPTHSLSFAQPFLQSAVLFLNNSVGPASISVLFFASILLLAGYMGYSIASTVSVTMSGKRNPMLEWLSIAFFMTNPFLYERLITQPTVALGIILLGWWIYSLLRPFIWWEHAWESRFSHIIIACIFFGAAWNFFAHASYMIVMLLLVYGSLFIRTRKEMFSLMLWVMSILVLNGNWLFVTFFSSTGTMLENIQAFSPENYTVFMTRWIEPLSVTLTNILLYGFWGEGHHFYRPWVMSPYWYIWWGVLMGLTGIGLLLHKKHTLTFSHRSRILIFLCIVGFAALVFGLGIATQWTKDINLFLYEYLPLFRGYREPQKWIWLLMIAEWWIFVLWMSYLILMVRAYFWRWILFWLTLLALFLWSPGMIFGFRGQLTTMAYPESFYALKRTLLWDMTVKKILILPWHSYIGCDWTEGRVIANPLPQFFLPLKTVSADNIEMRGLYTNSVNPESRVIEQFLRSEGKDQASFRSLHFSHILIARNCATRDEFPWMKYALPHCSIDQSEKEYTLLSCEHPMLP